MEALGAAGSTLAVAGAAHSAASQSVKFLRRVRKAPQEVQDLIRELSRMEVVLANAQLVCENDQDSSALQSFLEDANNQLTQLKKFMHQGSMKSPQAVEVKRVFWATHKEHIQKFLVRLKSTKDDITALVSVSHFLRAIDVNKQLKELLTTQKYRAETQEQPLKTPYNTNGASKEQDPSSPQTLTNRQLATGIAEDPTQAQRSILAASHLADYIPRKESSCPRSCRCVCHHWHNKSLFQITQRWTGAFFISYWGRLRLTPVCTMRGCRGLSTNAMTVRYTYPAWLANRMVSAWLKSAPLAGPELLLRTVRLVRTDAYALAESGKLHDLRAMYATGKASVHDADPYDGETALMAAVRGMQIEVARFLLQIGANQAQVDYNGFTAGDHAFCTPYFKQFEQLRAILDLEDAIDEQAFTSLHCIIIGLSGRNLFEEVQEHSHLVNVVDTKGRSALWWTAWCNEPKLAKVLIDAQADPYLRDAKGQTALHQCARTGSADLAETLLQSEILEDQEYSQESLQTIRNKYGHCPWQSAIFRDKPCVLKVLLNYGCNLNSQTSRGLSALHLVARYGSLKIVEVLKTADLSRINPDAKDDANMTADDYLRQYGPGHPAVPDRSEETVQKINELLDDARAAYCSSIFNAAGQVGARSLYQNLSAPPGAWPEVIEMS